MVYSTNRPDVLHTVCMSLLCNCLVTTFAANAEQQGCETTHWKQHELCVCATRLQTKVGGGMCRFTGCTMTLSSAAYFAAVHNAGFRLVLAVDAWQEGHNV